MILIFTRCGVFIANEKWNVTGEYMVVDLEHDIELISEEIQRYLFNHPNAADSVEGITRWWLTRQRYEEATSVVEKALEILIARGVVAQSTNADDQRIYSKRNAKVLSTRTQ